MESLDTYHLYKHAWVYYGPANCEKQLSITEAESFLKIDGWMLRNNYDFDCPMKTNFWYVIKDSFNGLQDVPSKYRSRVKKAIEAFDIKIVSREYIIENGYEVYVRAAENYRIKAQVPSYEEFKKRIMAEDGVFDLWGCVHKESGRLAAFAINHIIDNTVDYQTMKYHPDFLSKLHPSYGLIYEMNRYYLEEKKMLFVNDGSRSITEHSNIQPFLEEKFQFRKAYCHLKIYYKWWFGIIVRCLYPFRGIIKNNQIHAVLAMHGMQK